MKNVTAITVVYNTKELFRKAYDSVRSFHPDMPMVIVDGSDRKDPCYSYVAGLASNPLNNIHQVSHNIGHGKGMHYGIGKCTTPYALVFDSDIVMLKSPVREMLNLMFPSTYGVGWVTEIGFDGYDFGTPGKKHISAVPYLHPYFMLLNVDQYKCFFRFVHHGAPCYKAMTDLYNKNQSWRLRYFPGLTGHTKGSGINWQGKPSEFIQHDFGGTRLNNRKMGKKEIEGFWE